MHVRVMGRNRQVGSLRENVRRGRELGRSGMLIGELFWEFGGSDGGYDVMGFQKCVKGLEIRVNSISYKSYYRFKERSYTNIVPITHRIPF